MFLILIHMATVKRELSPKLNGNGKSEIIIRISVGRGIQPRLKSGLFIAPARFKAGEFIKPRANQKEAAEIRAVEAELTALEQHLLMLCETTPREQLDKEFFEKAIDRKLHPEKYQRKAPTRSVFDWLDMYLDKHPLSPARANHYKVLYRSLKRFECYMKETRHRRYQINPDTLTGEDLVRFEAFLRAEPELFDQYPQIYLDTPADTHKGRKSRRPLPKGDNTISDTFKRFRAFFNWCNENGLTNNNPFAKFTIKAATYGTPYYITTEERDIIAGWDFSFDKGLEIQRDIFIFHCYVGCRVSDLMRLTDANIINGGVEYIADKTKEERPEVIRVPLHPVAAALVEKYRGGKKLFPFITPQRYNDAIKAVFTLCGITRPVTVLNPTTGQEEQRPINQIASSHIARRTFVGNLYKQVKDPNLVGRLSGHKEGSKAFARYRDIDEDMRRDLINLL